MQFQPIKFSYENTPSLPTDCRSSADSILFAESAGKFSPCTQGTFGYTSCMKTPMVICTLMLLVTENGFCDSIPKETSLSRAQAIEMAVYQNIDLRVEGYNSEM